ncbi:MAG TPA: MFS transporter [Actinomycetota bacterium]|nr:MFS transporter [Actinomycetota bacterium]
MPHDASMAELAKGGSFRTALSRRDFRLVLGGLAISAVGDWMYGVALLAYIYDQTRSATWVAAAAILRLVPYLVLGTLGGVIADRFERRAVMLVCDAVRALLMFALALLAAADGPVLLAIVIVLFSASTATPYFPAVAAMTPALVPEDDLVAANSLMSVIDNIALALGPMIGGFLLIAGEAALAFAFNGVTFVASALCVVGVRTRSRGDEESEGGLRDRLVAGFAAIRDSADVAMMLAVLAASAMLYGQESVLLLYVSKDLLGTGSDGIAFLFAAIGVGGLLGAGVSNRLAKDPKLGRTLIVSMLLSGAALVGVAFVSVPIASYAFVALDGAGAVILDVLAVTLLQRVVASHVMARVFGILIMIGVGGTLIGSAVAPVTLNLFGLRPALLIAGGLMPVLALVGLPRFRALNERSARAAAELARSVELLGRLPIFEGATVASLEGIARAAKTRRAEAGEAVVTQGEPADDFYVVQSGELEVVSSGEASGPQRTVNRLGAGDHFGEIGLLEGIPRTATVQAISECELLAIGGDDFLDAVNGAAGLSGALRAGMVTRLARTHPSYRPRTATVEGAP